MSDRDRLMLLIGQQLHGELSAGDLAELERVLLRDPAAVRRYVEEAYLYHTVGATLGGNQAMRRHERGGDPSQAGLLGYELAADTMQEDGRRTNDSPVSFEQPIPARRPRAVSPEASDGRPKLLMSFAGINIYRQDQQAGLRLPLRFVGYAAAVLCLAGLAWWFLPGTAPQDDTGDWVEVPPALPAPEARDGFTEVSPGPESHDGGTGDQAKLSVTISKMSGAVWDSLRTDFDTETLRPGLRLEEQGRLSLAEGFVQLTTGKGASVLVEGPAQLELVDADTLHLERGSLVAEVPTRARLFTVSTPTALVVDLGTQFGVEVTPAGRTKALVYRGLVEMSAKPDQGLTGEALPKLLLRTGQQATARSDGTLQASPQPIDTKMRLARNWDDVMYRPEITGQAVWLSEPPASVHWHALSHIEAACVFVEQTGVPIAEPLERVLAKPGTYVGGETPLEEHVLGDGATVDSYLVHLSPPAGEGGLRSVRLTMRFPRPIAAAVVTGNRLFETDDLFARPGVGYQQLTDSESAVGRGIDPTQSKRLPDDSVQIHDDGRAITLVLHANTFYDQVRVLVHSARSGAPADTRGEEAEPLTAPSTQDDASR